MAGLEPMTPGTPAAVGVGSKARGEEGMAGAAAKVHVRSERSKESRKMRQHPWLRSGRLIAGERGRLARHGVATRYADGRLGTSALSKVDFGVAELVRVRESRRNLVVFRSLTTSATPLSS